MSIKKAFELLKNEPGFVFKDEQSFEDAIIDKGPQKLQLMVNLIRKSYPDAVYIDFEAEYDTTNRINELCDYKIVDKDENDIIHVDDLRSTNFNLHSQIFNALTDTLVEGLDISEFAPEEFRFYLDDLEYECM